MPGAPGPIHDTADPNQKRPRLRELGRSQAASGSHQVAAAQAAQEAFEQGPWGQRFPRAAASWHRARDRAIHSSRPPAVRRVTYTTAIESINAQLRRIHPVRRPPPQENLETPRTHKFEYFRRSHYPLRLGKTYMQQGPHTSQYAGLVISQTRLNAP